jgi:hypothetical protein
MHMLSHVHAVPTPHLATLKAKPSWHNRAGRTDRSACCELSVRDARKLAQRAGVCDAAWKSASSSSSVQPSYISVDAGSQTPARARTSTSASIALTITAAQLFTLHSARNPCVLQGDKRTPKSNAMRVNGCLSYNPNAGACRDKILGLPAEPIEWQQPITLLCPTRSQCDRAQRNSHDNPVPAANNHFLLCPACDAKVRKLFLPLCTDAEFDDAMLAQSWLRMYDHMIRRHMTEVYALRTKIIARYGLLFAPRTLACRMCLGIRYGESKASRAL